MNIQAEWKEQEFRSRRRFSLTLGNDGGCGRLAARGAATWRRGWQVTFFEWKKSSQT